ncbi:hypothetical protein [Candidatus Portiera aleyrodidarum]|uniref:Uncharacterized protein n=1 Tax=Candidatus Portiera aleyrodidarum TaxID=91844 RepID=A0A6S6S5F6_9GAMM|nr:hypothetical protein [Candidatus Portiera aleyrodidarum]CAA3708831.1 hypothetical protein PEMO_0270 [Candidatus Portiera aleyrodidarum]
MKYKIQKKLKTIHNKINNIYNFKLINKNFICIGFLQNNKKYFIYMYYIKNKVNNNKSVNRNLLKRLFKEYIRVFQYNLINVYIILYIKKYIFKKIIYILLNKLLIKIINF